MRSGCPHDVGRPANLDLVVDTSALIAILVDEPIADLVEAELVKSHGTVVSAASVLEASMVATSRRGEEGPFCSTNYSRDPRRS